MEREIVAKLKRETSGITLVALVVTIVVLIILAIVSMNLALGEKGVIQITQKAKVEYTHQEVWEAMVVKYSSYKLEKIEKKVEMKSNLIEYLQEKEVIGKEKIDAGYVINTEKLLGGKVALGNGTDGRNDVYKLEEVTTGTAKTTKLASTNQKIRLADEDEAETKYKVKYYGESGDRDLGILGDSTSSSEPGTAGTAGIDVKLEVISELPTELQEGYNNAGFLPGEKIEYQITVANTGTATLTNISVTNTLTDNFENEKEKRTYPIERLEAGKSEVIDYSYTVQYDDPQRDIYGDWTDTFLNNTVYAKSEAEGSGGELPEGSDEKSVPLATAGREIHASGESNVIGGGWTYEGLNDEDNSYIEVEGERNNLKYNSDYIIELYKVADVSGSYETGTFIGEFKEPVNELLRKYDMTESDLDFSRLWFAVDLKNTCYEVIKDKGVEPDFVINIGERKKMNINNGGLYLIVANESWCDKGYCPGGLGFELTNDSNMQNKFIWNDAFPESTAEVYCTDDSGNFLEGVQWTLCNQNGDIITNPDGSPKYLYISGNEKSLEKVPQGTYYIKVLKEPGGYLIPEDKLVKIAGNEENTLVIELTANKIKINCVDEAGKDIPGAVVAIKDDEGNFIYDDAGRSKYTFVSTGEQMEIRHLPKGNYFLSAVEPPEKCNKPLDVPFVVNADDKEVYVKIIFEKDTSEQGGTIVVTKNLETFTGEAVTVSDETFYVALFEDEARTQSVGNVIPMKFSNASSQTVTFTGLNPDKTYYVSEVDESGNPLDNGMTKNGVIYGAVFPDGNCCELTLTKPNVNVVFQNLFSEVP